MSAKKQTKKRPSKKQRQKLRRNQLTKARAFHITAKSRSDVVVRIERPGSGVEVGTAKLLINDFKHILWQLELQVRDLLNKPYGTERQHGGAALWSWDDFELFAGHNFDEKDLISSDKETARFQVCCLAFCDIPVVACRKRSAVWVDVEVQTNTNKTRIVRNVKPISLFQIVRACIPKAKTKDYKVTFDGSEEQPTTKIGPYMCDASCRRATLECRGA